MEQNYNPNSWSELPLDLLNLVFERLSFANFQRAKSVCSSWYSASRQSVPKKQIPWLILFPTDKDKDKNSSSCMLFNPEEKDKLYITQDLGVDFANSFCRATYGSWLLMEDSKCILYILNPFTHERIDLPAVESQQLGMVKVERTLDDEFFLSYRNEVRSYKRGPVRNHVFWIDEKTKDYVVLWGLGSWCVVYSKKGDKYWNQVPEIIDSYEMVYKDHKLYSLNDKYIFTILDFSGEIPLLTFQSSMPLYRRPSIHESSGSWYVSETKLVITVTGDCLLVERMSMFNWPTIQAFYVYKFYSSGTYFHKEYEQVYSLDDEAILLDLGITVLANEVEGLDSSFIYFSGGYDKTTNDLFVFNLESQTMELLQEFDFDCLLVKPSARWFLHNLSHT